MQRWRLCLSGDLTNEYFFDGTGPLTQFSGVAGRNTGIATRERPTEATSGHDDHFGLDPRLSRSPSDSVGEHPSSHALRHRWGVAARCRARPSAPTGYGLPGE